MSGVRHCHWDRQRSVASSAFRHRSPQRVVELLERAGKLREDCEAIVLARGSLSQPPLRASRLRRALIPPRCRREARGGQDEQQNGRHLCQNTEQRLGRRLEAAFGEPEHADGAGGREAAERPESCAGRKSWISAGAGRSEAARSKVATANEAAAWIRNMTPIAWMNR